jgi:Arrestin (or S-antigen), N-terminal domain/SpoOM protein
MVFGWFGGKGIDISIGLDRQDAVYAVGDTVRTMITLAAERGGKVREVRAGLVRQHRFQVVSQQRDSGGDYQDNFVWRTNETWVHREVLAASGDLSANDSFKFEWQIPPDTAGSCHGEVVQVKWLVKVTVDRAMARDQNEEVELTVLTRAPGVYTQSGDFGDMNTSSGVAMKLSLPTLELVEGDTLRGRLSIDPSQSIDAREVRVELVRDERVNVGDRAHNKQKSMQRVQVAASPKLEPGRPLAYDFTLPVPEAGSPSHDLGDTVVMWLVVGTIDRPMRGDYTVTKWVGVYNR